MSCTLDPRVRAALQQDRTIELTTTGRVSGRPRRVEIWLLDVDGRAVITGTPGPRHWLANIRADPRVTVHLRHGTRAELAATAVEVTDPAARRTVIEHEAAAWYRSRATLHELLAAAPMVQLTFSPFDACDRHNAPSVG